MNSIGIPYDREPDAYVDSGTSRIASFTSDGDGSTIDPETVRSFGEEWGKFHGFSDGELERIGSEYFDIVGDEMIGPEAVALDVGCGSGRWAQYLSRRAGFVEAVDPSSAILQAAARLEGTGNVRVTQAGVGELPFPDGSFDFVLSLGVLHHVPDTERALGLCVGKLKPGGHLLLYLYYALDNRGPLYAAVWGASNLLRKIVSRLPGPLKRLICDAIAAFVYLPLVFVVRVLASLDVLPGLRRRLPLAYYADKSFYIMRNDALDRFGTPLERRFTKDEIRGMMERSGLDNVRFSEHAPYWHAVGRRRQAPRPANSA